MGEVYGRIRQSLFTHLSEYVTTRSSKEFSLSIGIYPAHTFLSLYKNWVTQPVNELDDR